MEYETVIILVAAFALSTAGEKNSGFYQSAATRGDVRAQNILGLLYLNSRKDIACDIFSSGAAIEQIVLPKKYADGQLDNNTTAAFSMVPKGSGTGK